MADPTMPSDGLTRILIGLIGPGISAAVGISMRLAQDLADGTRWSWRRLLLEVPSVVGIAVACAGAAEWLHLSTTAASGMAAIAGYVGPKVIVSLIARKVGKVGQ